ncbi:hypothetical protein K461DRAFT_231583 [Myriangium duriaei CBS 260.36]|uniref:Uncharacterized protein n=1 Tax=Myriangium duriaei CBS 260.36 TaxID=1168546 RepID=A0A9P4ITS8_9PEZI|nr:hypothetical protein K461DRAFT_231583 [Myriangium duriaei CBS 260.36]
MDANSLAAFRRTFGDELGALAEEHYRHDLQASDRTALLSAAKSASTYASIGSFAGIALGIFFAARLRSQRKQLFAAFKAAERPTQVTFANGRTEALPDLTPYLKPSTLGDVAAYTFFGLGGLFIGGELGLVAGAGSARRTIASDPESKARIENAFRKFRAEMLRKQADDLDKGQGVLGI